MKVFNFNVEPTSHSSANHHVSANLHSPKLGDVLTPPRGRPLSARKQTFCCSGFDADEWQRTATFGRSVGFCMPGLRLEPTACCQAEPYEQEH